MKNAIQLQYSRWLWGRSATRLANRRRFQQMQSFSVQWKHACLVKAFLTQQIKSIIAISEMKRTDWEFTIWQWRTYVIVYIHMGGFRILNTHEVHKFLVFGTNTINMKPQLVRKQNRRKVKIAQIKCKRRLATFLPYRDILLPKPPSNLQGKNQHHRSWTQQRRIHLYLAHVDKTDSQNYGFANTLT